MKVRADIAELLRAGHSETHIAHHLHVDRGTVARARKLLGLPTPRRGKRSRYPSLAAVFLGNTEQLDDGHVRWTGYRDGTSNTPLVLHGGQRVPAPRVAFQLHHGRKPIGKALPACGMKGCVAGAHLADRRIREANKRADRAFDAIFGASA